MKKRLIALLLLLSLLALSGCSGYVSSYRAVGFVHSALGQTAFMNFFSFEGTMVLNLRCPADGLKISYDAKLESGSAAVFYDCAGTKTPLFTISAGEELSGAGGALTKGPVTLIVETSGGACGNGDFHFQID
ncbi:MAG: hypothetical protein IKP40_08515 [Clostridia bacterium]|nr:hypothetical protein [Clostridia bacterium]